MKKRLVDELESYELDSRFDLRFGDEAFRACYSLCGGIISCQGLSLKLIVLISLLSFLKNCTSLT